MSHDLLAELAGYRNERDAAKRYSENDKAKAVQGEIDRVTGNIRARVKELHDEAAEHDNNGQHLLGAQARTEATRLRRAVEDSPAAENATDSTPREKAVNTRGKR